MKLVYAALIVFGIGLIIYSSKSESVHSSYEQLSRRVMGASKTPVDSKRDGYRERQPNYGDARYEEPFTHGGAEDFVAGLDEKRPLHKGLLEGMEGPFSKPYYSERIEERATSNEGDKRVLIDHITDEAESRTLISGLNKEVKTGQLSGPVDDLYTIRDEYGAQAQLSLKADAAKAFEPVVSKTYDINSAGTININKMRDGSYGDDRIYNVPVPSGDERIELSTNRALNDKGIATCMGERAAITMPTSGLVSRPNVYRVNTRKGTCLPMGVGSAIGSIISSGSKLIQRIDTNGNKKHDNIWYTRTGAISLQTTGVIYNRDTFIPLPSVKDALTHAPRTHITGERGARTDAQNDRQVKLRALMEGATRTGNLNISGNGNGRINVAMFGGISSYDTIEGKVGLPLLAKNDLATINFHSNTGFREGLEGEAGSRESIPNKVNNMERGDAPVLYDVGNKTLEYDPAYRPVQARSSEQGSFLSHSGHDISLDERTDFVIKRTNGRLDPVFE